MNELAVFVDIAGKPVRAGTAYFTVGRQRPTTSFVYDAAYLSDPRGVDIEPRLPRQAGQQYVDGLPGAFRDCSPDRWGRNLLDKRHRAAQRDSQRLLPAITDVDYLLGVSDVSRQGDLRFCAAQGGSFLDPAPDVPRLVSLRRLLASADKVSDAGDDDLAAVEELLDAGSASLGGARPKASVQSDEHTLLIAKFPHANDRWDVMAWEKTCLDLAAAAGISAPGRHLSKVGGRTVLLVDRFDRAGAGSRLGYVSAMTLLGAGEGDDRDYLDVADAIAEHGARVKDDLAELFRRVVLNVALHNCDDHLRNHGFLRAQGGWKLSPVFDVNPEPDPGKGRVTSIAGAVHADEEAAALPDLADQCRLPRDRAGAIMAEVCRAAGRWRSAATANGIGRAEQSIFGDTIEDRLTALRALTS